MASEDNMPRPEPAAHPLKNTLVLKSVLQYDTAPKTVVRNRLVCRSWREASDPLWRQTPKYPVLRYSSPDPGNPDAKKLVTLFELYNRYREHDPVVAPLINIPPKRMELHAWKNFVGDSNLNEIDVWFWSRTSSRMLTSLTLTNCEFRYDIPIYKESFLEAVPSLETLILKDCLVHPAAMETVNNEHLHYLENYAEYAHIRLRDPFNNQEFQHRNLHTLDIKLTHVSQENAQPLRLWNLLFAVLPKIRKLKVGLVDHAHHVDGYFRDLFDGIEKGRLELTHLDLLDFSGQAQERGIIPLRGDHSSSLSEMAFDLGICPYYSHAYCSLNKPNKLRRLTLYRAPFADDFPRVHFELDVSGLELWGNCSPNLEFQNLGKMGKFRKLMWNTTCYDSTFKGKRIHHLLDSERIAYPLFTQDLVMKTQDSFLQYLGYLYQLDIDFGPLSEKSWYRLGDHARGLTTLRAVIGEDHHLNLVARHWPYLIELELKHRSQVSLQTLAAILSNLRNLRKFSWKSCACVQPYFTDKDKVQLREIEQSCSRMQKLDLPWKWDGDELVREEICDQAEFESKLLKASTEVTFGHLKAENAMLKRKLTELRDKYEEEIQNKKCK